MGKWKLGTIDIGLIDEAELNANKMPEKAFARLVENIKKSGGLSSAIACYKRGDRYIIISGHHRYRACVKLRYKEIPVIYADESDLSRDEIIALQLSHNSLHGEDNKGILKRMFDEIQSVDFREFAFIDTNDIDNIALEGVSFGVESEHFTVSLILFKKDIDTLKELLGIVEQEKEMRDMVILADGEATEEPYLTIAAEINKEFNIKSSNITFAKILQLAQERMKEIKGYE